MKYRFRIYRLGLAVLVVIALAALGAAQDQTPANTTDPAYVAGYNAGYSAGTTDKANDVEANAHKFKIYQDADQGYTDIYGSRQQYHDGFQSGFEDGYQDGYAGRARTIAIPPSPTLTPTAPPASVNSAAVPTAPAPDPNVAVARGNGYREGYAVGQADANRSASYDSTASGEYKDAMVGYNRTLGVPDQYQLNFRSGFEMGYDDGFHHRLYQSAIGTRAAAPLSDSIPSPATGNVLPTDPAQLSSRASGIYDNGILLAQGTAIHAELDQTLDTKTTQAGANFTLTVTIPVWVGAVAAVPAGSKINATVEQVTRGGKASGHAQLQLQYNTIAVPGQPPIAFNATTAAVGAGADKVNSDEGTVNGQGSGAGGRAAKDAAIGGMLGGIFGGYGGLIKGGIAGAAVGATGAILSHKKDITLNAGMHVMVSLQQPLVLPRS